MIKREIIDAYHVNSDKIRVVYNGVESKNIDYSRAFAKLSKEFNIDKEAPVLLYVGSGFKRKGVEEFLQIIAKLNINNIKAFVVGKERDMERYLQASKDLGIDQQVEFTGPRTDVDDFYAISDLFILPTHYEPFSNVILEAMSFENVVITTKQNGASEIISQDCIMKTPRDYNIANTIESILSNHELMTLIKSNNRRIAKKYSINRNVEETLEVVREFSNF